MSLASEMTRLAGEFEAAQAARLATVAGIASAARTDLDDGRASLGRTMSELTKAIQVDLRGIFSEVALIRGATKDSVDGFAAERDARAEALRAELGRYMADLHSSVENLLSELARAREATGRREAAAREAYLKDLRARVEALLTDVRKRMTRLGKERARAGRIWRQHGRNLHKQRREAARPSPAPAKPEPTAKKKAAKD